MLQSPFFWYGICWICIKFSNFGKAWDLLTVSIVAAAALIAAIFLIDLVKSLLSNGKQGILFTAVMIMGAINFVANEFFHVGWYLKFDNPTIDNVVRWGMMAGVSYMCAVILRMAIIGHKGEEEREEC